MADHDPDLQALLHAFARHAHLGLNPEDQQKLEDYVADVWAMAASLREVEQPGLEGLGHRLPRRTAYANLPAAKPPAAPTGSSGERPHEQTPRRAPADAHEWSLEQAANALRSGAITPVDLTAAMLERIRHHDRAVRSYITVAEERALADAQCLTQELERHGPRSALHGIPIGIKDNIPAEGMPCTYNSRLAETWLPKRDAEAVRRLRSAGAVILGKHNLNEFGWSLPTEDDFAPPPRNPWFPEEYSVGSSSGGGAAVASRFCMAALGTDGGGSTRLPAGQHLLFGLKPTHERVPRQGVSDGNVSEVGILTRTAVDAALVLATLLVDPDASAAHATRRNHPEAMAAYVRQSPGKVRVGVPGTYLEQVGMEEDVAAAFEDSLRACEDVGCEIIQLAPGALNVLHDAVRANFVVIAAEHYSDHERTATTQRDRYGASAGFYNLPGAFLTAGDYLNALRVGAIARAAVDEELRQVDVLLLPTSPVTRTTTARNPKTHRKGGNAAYTSPFNITGHPALSLPVRLSWEGMPIGVQLVGAYGSEFDLLRLGRAIVEKFTLPPYPKMETSAV